MFVVYVLINRERDRIYVGQTSNLEERLLRHNKIKKSKSTSFTSKNSGLWEVAYTEQVNTRTEALKREKELKSYQGRQFIKVKILGR
jgi:putative endonuclease